MKSFKRSWLPGNCWGSVERREWRRFVSDWLWRWARYSRTARAEDCLQTGLLPHWLSPNGNQPHHSPCSRRAACLQLERDRGTYPTPHIQPPVLPIHCVKDILPAGDFNVFIFGGTLWTLEEIWRKGEWNWSDVSKGSTEYSEVFFTLIRRLGITGRDIVQVKYLLKGMMETEVGSSSGLPIVIL